MSASHDESMEKKQAALRQLQLELKWYKQCAKVLKSGQGKLFGLVGVELNGLSMHMLILILVLLFIVVFHTLFLTLCCC